jgi:predicted site-specific integrase-resolvase
MGVAPYCDRLLRRFGRSVAGVNNGDCGKAGVLRQSLGPFSESIATSEAVSVEFTLRLRHSWPIMSLMKTIGYVRVSTDKQADRGVSLEAQAEMIRAMAVVHNAELVDIIVDGGESAKSLNRPGMARLLALVDAGAVKAVIIAKLDRLTRSVKDLCTLLERFERRGVALVSVAESLDTGSAAGRLVLNIMTAVSQW